MNPKPQGPYLSAGRQRGDIILADKVFIRSTAWSRTTDLNVVIKNSRRFLKASGVFLWEQVEMMVRPGV
jgi:hypothetical protein